MTYNDWRDELKNNLLNVSEAERRRVLDYYAEAYADRRAAGFSEREIIEGFGAPYDAAQAILDDGYESAPEPPRERRKERSRDSYFDEPVRESRSDERYREDRYRDERPEPVKAERKKPGTGATLLLVLFCIIFAAPIFGLIMAAFGITVGLVVGPVAIGISGGASIVQGIVWMISTLSLEGLDSVGIGIILIGVAVILVPLCIKLVKLLWKVYGMIFRAIRDLFRGN